jgi:hypothetical protein
MVPFNGIMSSFSNTVVTAPKSGVVSAAGNVAVSVDMEDASAAYNNEDGCSYDEAMNQEKMVAILAQELNRLSFVDRTNVQEEIHGVYSVTPEETPKLIEEALVDFSHQISLFPPGKALAYQQALSLNSQYVHDRDFRLKFIRADLYNIPRAVERFMAYLDVTVDHFGTDVLLRPVMQNDLTRLEFEVMRKGGLQILSSRDRAGRLVIVYQGVMHAEGLDMKSMVRR